MKFYHISDLHLGREFNGFDILDDQRYVLDDIINKLKENEAKYLLISGDIFDKYNPSNEATNLYNEFLVKLSSLNIRTIIISGNHDSKDKIKYLNSFLTNYNIYVYTEIDSLAFDDDKVAFFLLPYHSEPELFHKYKEYGNSSDEIYKALANNFFDNIDKDYTKICLCHNMIVGGLSSDSERNISVGGADALSANIFEGFEYTALGHLHKIQRISDNVRYSGSILKYSTSEFSNKNSMLVFDSITNDVNILELKTLHNYRCIEGYFDDILKGASSDPFKDDFVEIRLLDKITINDAYHILIGYYKNIVSFVYESRLDVKAEATTKNVVLNLDDISNVFSSFYLKQLGQDIPDDEKEIVDEIIKEIHEEHEDEN